MTFCDNLLKSFSENLKQLTKMNDFLSFLRFHENRRILSLFSLEILNSACKNTLVSVYILNILYKAKFRLIVSKAIDLRFSRFSQKFQNF